MNAELAALPKGGAAFFGRIRGIMGFIYYIIVTKVK